MLLEDCLQETGLWDAKIIVICPNYYYTLYRQKSNVHTREYTFGVLLLDKILAQHTSMTIKKRIVSRAIQIRSASIDLESIGFEIINEQAPVASCCSFPMHSTTLYSSS